MRSSSLVAGAVALAIAACARPGVSPDGIVLGASHPLVYFVAPKLGGADLEGRPVAPDALMGHVAVVRFWATWAPHARDALVSLARLSDRHGADDLRVIAVSVDAEATAPDEIARVVGARFTIAWDPARDLARRWNVAHVPTTFVIDRVGIARAVFTDDDTARDDAAIERDVEILLGRPVPSDEAPK